MIIILQSLINVRHSGYFKIWPGTFGSLISIFILFPFIEFKLMSLEIFIVFFILFFFLSLFFIKKYSLYSNSHDSSVIVIDEFLGIYLILILTFLHMNLKFKKVKL